MEKPKFKVGDWCFCEFILQQVVRTEEDKVIEVTDGFLNLSGNNLNDVCYPLDLEIKRISDEVESWSRKFHSLKINGINYPDLNRMLIHKWCILCENKDYEDTLTKLYKDLSEFGNSIIKRIEDLQREEINGIRLFRN